MEQMNPSQLSMQPEQWICQTIFLSFDNDNNKEHNCNDNSHINRDMSIGSYNKMTTTTITSTPTFTDTYNSNATNNAPKENQTWKHPKPQTLIPEMPKTSNPNPKNAQNLEP